MSFLDPDAIAVPAAGSADQASDTLSQPRLAARSRQARLAARLSVAAPLLGVGLGAVLLGRGRLAARAAGFGLLGTSVGLALLRWQLGRFFVENAAYEVEGYVGDIEVRRYAPQMRAETTVEHSTWSEAMGEGFRRLAGYIFGDNEGMVRPSTVPPGAPAPRESMASREPPPASPAAVADPSGWISAAENALEDAAQSAMDAARAAGVGERMAMTAPVLATVGHANAVLDRTVAFLLPADRELAPPPKPSDPRVRVTTLPERRVAVLRFAGPYEGDLPVEKSKDLLRGLHTAGLVAKGQVTFAGYDPPSTLPWLRRNEVQVDLEDASVP